MIKNITSLIHLAECDQQILTFQNFLNKNKLIQADLLKKNSEYNAQKLVVYKVLHEAQKNVDLSNLELKTADSKISFLKARLVNLASLKEYSSVLKEIESLEKLKEFLENKIIDLWNLVELKEVEYNNFNQNFEDDIKNVESIISELENRIALYLKKRAELVQLVDNDQLALYESMRLSISNPLVHVSGKSCSGCFFELRSADYSRIRANDLVRCSNCFRLLYSSSSLNTE